MRGGRYVGWMKQRRLSSKPGEPEYSGMRDEGSVWRIGSLDGARQVLRARHATKQAGFTAEFIPTGVLRHHPILMSDGPLHDEQRSKVARFFAPKVVSERYSDDIAAAADRYVEKAASAGTLDLDELALHYSVEVTAKIVGLDAAPVPAMSKRLVSFFRQPPLDLTKPMLGRTGKQWATAAVNGLVPLVRFHLADVRPAIRTRRRKPGDDVLSHLIREDYTDLDILVEAVTYGTAGMVTTREFISMAAWHLLRDDGLRSRYLSAEQDERIGILNEIIRLEPVVGHLYRRAVSAFEVELDGDTARVEPGDLLDISVRHANADPDAVGQDPLSLCPFRDLPRGVDPSGLAFGDGAHRCPGQPLAMAETDALLVRLFGRGVSLVAEPTMGWDDLIEGYTVRGLRVQVPTRPDAPRHAPQPTRGTTVTRLLRRPRTHDLPGRDPRAVLHPAKGGAQKIDGRQVVVVGGGIAGIAAAAGLAERGVAVTLMEADDRLGGRVAAWELDDGRTMSRGFHAFFRQYYNLRGLLKRIDPKLSFLIPIEDYPLQRPDGLRDSFTNLPKTPPWSVAQFVRQSPSFTLKSLSRVNVPTALELLRVKFPDTYHTYGEESAADFLDRLRFPAEARDLALEVFARSFFADPSNFSAGELVAMFHTYFMGSAEGLLFDVPDDDYQTVLWGQLEEYLTDVGVTVRFGARVDELHLEPEATGVTVDGERVAADAIVLATDPRAARGLVEQLPTGHGLTRWHDDVADTVNAPPFVVVRLWLADAVHEDRPAFLGTSGYGPLDNVSVLERFEAGAADWAKEHGGSVVELHAYACDPAVMTDEAAASAVVDRLKDEMYRVFPETKASAVLGEEVLVRDDCTLIPPARWEDRPGVTTPSPRLMLAGDWVRCDYPVALMERAATTGFIAANNLLEPWGAAGHDLWTVPMRGILARR